MTKARELLICPRCGHNRYADGRCSNGRCPEAAGMSSGFSSLREILSRGNEIPLVNGRVWGRWRLNLNNLTLTHPQYEIDLEAIRSAAQMLDRIYQIEMKRWAGERDLADLLTAFRHIFDPQANFCPVRLDAGAGTPRARMPLRSPRQPKMPAPSEPDSKRECAVA